MHRHRPLYYIISLFLCIFLSSETAASKTIFVSIEADGTGDGTSWEQAFPTISAGITDATSGDEIWVQQGTYNEAIVLKDGIALYGGFHGDEDILEQREMDPAKTVIDAAGLQTNVVIAAKLNRIDTFTITRGYASQGRGIFCSNSDLIINNCLITKNGISTDPRGIGGTILSEDSILVIKNSYITDNCTQSSQNSIICIRNSNVQFVNCVVSRNIGWDGKREIFSIGTSVVNIMNCVIVQNESNPTFFFFSSRSDVKIHNSIVKNSVREFNSLSSVLSDFITYSNIKGGWPGEGNFDLDPMFVDAANGDFRLQDGSPCIDRGLASVAPATDIEGNPRPGGDGLVDIGAFESPAEFEPEPSKVYRVRVDAATGGDGLSWENAFDSIQEAIDTTQSLDEVWVASGTYEEVVTTNMHMNLYGGFAGTETDRNQRDWQANKTTIDAGTREDEVWTLGWEDASDIDGFTVIGKPERYAMVADGLGGTLSNCTLLAHASGGGFRQAIGVEVHSIPDLAANIVNCRITGGANPVISTSSGLLDIRDCILGPSETTGVDLRRTAASFTNCTIFGSRLLGIFTDKTFLIMDRCRIVDNGIGGLFSNALENEPFPFEGLGDGFSCVDRPTLINCLIARNGGWGVGAQRNQVDLSHCTIADNLSGGILQTRFRLIDGDEVITECEPIPSIRNSIIENETPFQITWRTWERTGIFSYRFIEERTPSKEEGADIKGSIIRGGWPGQGNLDTLPLFVNRAAGDYRLRSGSPGIDGGVEDGAQLVDLNGTLRPMAIPGQGAGLSSFDIGAFEYTPPGHFFIRTSRPLAADIRRKRHERNRLPNKTRPNPRRPPHARRHI